jgi:hypothetical protein
MSLRLLFSALTALCTVSACATHTAREPVEKAIVKRQAAQEVERICALPEPEREAERKKVEQESGFIIYCAGEH